MKKVADETMEARVRIIEDLNHLRGELSEMSNQLQSLPHESSPIDTNNDHEHNVSPRVLSAYAEQLVAASLREEYLLDITRLVKSLHFEGDGHRYSIITEAHPRTFEWAYQHRFVQTLRSDEPLFWISGKPGSGKSTFMKFVVDNPRTAPYLRDWAGQRAMIVSSYFFWINGNKTQRSQEGLLRSVILDILLQCPELRNIALRSVKDLYGSNWRIFGESILWNISRLFDLLRLLVAGSQATYCLCLFIDGLDEYDGEPQGLIDLLIGLREFRNVKLCVSSRPWNQFESAFGFSQQHKIYMQDLSRGDIRIFVEDKLEQNADFRRMQKQSASVEHLVSAISDRAQGVFLWVRLVVQSLLQGLQNADRIIDLSRRLEAYPPDLDDFFRYILESVDPVYHVQVAQGFTAVQAAPEALSILQFWYLDHEDEDPNYAIKSTLSPTYAPEKLPRLRRRDGRRALDMTKRLAGRFKCFLDITQTTSGRSYLSEEGARIYEMKVDFLHRTVNDFLGTKTSQEILRSWTAASFNVYRSLYKAYLADLKDACNRPECLINTSSLKALVMNLFYVSTASKAKTGDDLDCLVQNLLSMSKRPTPSYHGSSLEELLGKSLFLMPRTRSQDHPVPVEDDPTSGSEDDFTSDFEDDLVGGSGDSAAMVRLLTEPLSSSVCQNSRSILRQTREFWCCINYFKQSSRRFDWARNLIQAPKYQLLDEKSLARHLIQGSNATADQVRYALISGQMSRIFIRRLLECMAEARRR